MNRQFCDRCGKDVTDVPSAAVHGIADADADGNGRHTDSFDHVCRRCFSQWKKFMKSGPKERAK